MRLCVALLAFLACAACKRSDKVTVANPTQSLDAQSQTPPEKVPAIHVGVTAANRILGEGVFSEHATVSIGSDKTNTLRIPAEYGVSSRTVIRDGALVVADSDRLAKGPYPFMASSS